jgi:hypothetical protein
MTPLASSAPSAGHAFSANAPARGLPLRQACALQQASPLPSLLVNGLREDGQCLSIARNIADILRDELLNPRRPAPARRCPR